MRLEASEGGLAKIPATARPTVAGLMVASILQCSNVVGVQPPLGFVRWILNMAVHKAIHTVVPDTAVPAEILSYPDGVSARFS